MKIDARQPIVQIEPDILHDLVKEVKETLAVNMNLEKARSRVFTSADLWNIRRNTRTAQARFRS